MNSIWIYIIFSRNDLQNKKLIIIKHAQKNLKHQGSNILSTEVYEKLKTEKFKASTEIHT